MNNSYVGIKLYINNGVRRIIETHRSQDRELRLTYVSDGRGSLLPRDEDDLVCEKQMSPGPVVDHGPKDCEVMGQVQRMIFILL